MEVRVATVCDFAQVREGLLFVSSGGITRLRRPSLPAPAGVMVAFVGAFDSIELQRPHEIELYVRSQDGHEHGNIAGVFGLNGPPNIHPGEKQQLPLAFDLRTMSLDREGAYDIAIYIDGTHKVTLTVYLELVTPPPADQPDEE